MKTRREILEIFIEQDPNDSFSRYALALEYAKGGADAEAVRELREVISRDPEYVAAYYHLGRILSRMGNSADARKVLNKGLEVASAAGDQKTLRETQTLLDIIG